MKKLDLDLVPERENPSPDYYCTWQSQLYACCNKGPQAQRDIMTEQGVFGTGDPARDTALGLGWAHQYKDAQKDLFLVLDDSWDVPIGAAPDGGRWYGSLALARDKFPHAYGMERAAPFTEDEPIDMDEVEGAMKRLSDKVKALGWRGLGGWVCVQKANMGIDVRKTNGNRNAKKMTDEDYWREAVLRCGRAGWRYWKMDWGKDASSPEVRNLVTELAHRYAPELYIEHAIAHKVIPVADVFRSYDAFTLMAIPLTISRMAKFLAYDTEAGYGGLVNCEDEPYVAAALGCTLGVMRHGMTGNLPNGSPDASFPALHRNFKTKLAEVVRTVRWHRIAPAFGACGKETLVDAEQLTDTWDVVSQPREIEAWWKYTDGSHIEESAPARMARRLPLADVTRDSEGERPFVISSRNPNGVVSVATLGRTAGRRYFLPRCEVTQEIGNADTVGLFGHYAAAVLKGSAITASTKVYMQDLAGDTAYDITEHCTVADGMLTIPGEYIDRIGTLANGAGDTSEPGVVVKLV